MAKAGICLSLVPGGGKCHNAYTSVLLPCTAGYYFGPNNSYPTSRWHFRSDTWT